MEKPIAFTCTKNEYVPEKYFESEPGEKQSDRSKLIMLNKMYVNIIRLQLLKR